VWEREPLIVGARLINSAHTGVVLAATSVAIDFAPETKGLSPSEFTKV
jgi:hypothetical protein